MVRGQAFTLESIVASVLLITGLVFAIQASAVTPLSSSTSNQHVLNQQGSAAQSVLLLAADRGTLRVAVLNWNATGGRFFEAEQTHHAGPPPNDFGTLVADHLGTNGTRYNVNVRYQNRRGETRSQRMVYQGEPSAGAVRASVAITLVDGDRRFDATETPTGGTINASTFYAPDRATGSRFYNLLTVEVVLWRA